MDHGVMRRRLASLVVVALVAAAHAGDLEYDVELLPSESDWLLALPSGVNDQGEICGVYVDAGGWYFAQKGIVWRGGAYEDLASIAGMPAGRDYSQANAINNRGVVVGSAYGLSGTTTTAPQVAVAWDLRAGTHRVLHPPTFGYAESSAAAVDDTGRIVGAARTFDPANGVFEQRAVVWEPGAAPRLLPFPSGSTYTVSAAFAVHDSGLMAGWTQPDLFSQEPHATVWLPDGRILDLHSAIVALDSRMTWTRAFGVDENGRVVGHAFGVSNSDGLAWAWTLDGGVVGLDSTGRAPFIVHDAIGDFADLVVGAAGDPNLGEQRAAVWNAGDRVDLPLLTGIRNMWTTGVNTKGVFVGQAILPPGAFWWQGCRGYVATPAPDPGRLLARLVGMVERADLPDGLRNALLAKLSAAARGTNDADVNAGPLGAFGNLVRAQRGKAIPADLADTWRSDAAEIESLLDD